MFKKRLRFLQKRTFAGCFFVLRREGEHEKGDAATMRQNKTSGQTAKNTFVIVNAVRQSGGHTAQNQAGTHHRQDDTRHEHDVFDQLGDFA